MQNSGGEQPVKCEAAGDWVALSDQQTEVMSINRTELRAK